MASSNPVPCLAEVLKIAHVLFLRLESPRASDTSAAVIEPGMSCYPQEACHIITQHIQQTLAISDGGHGL
jgi:hypothetical protein